MWQASRQRSTWHLAYCQTIVDNPVVEKNPVFIADLCSCGMSNFKFESSPQPSINFDCWQVSAWGFQSI